ncbi:hypothetical protein BT96DRAFT_841737, partial [Gymnopus androsaceus JB14]
LNHEQTPKVVDSVCWDHQGSLVTGNLLTADSMVTESVSMSIGIFQFFNNHGGAFDKLKLTQSLHSPETKPILLFLPAATCQSCKLEAALIHQQNLGELDSTG